MAHFVDCFVDQPIIHWVLKDFRILRISTFAATHTKVLRIVVVPEQPKTIGREEISMCCLHSPGKNEGGRGSDIVLHRRRRRKIALYFLIAVDEEGKWVRACGVVREERKLRASRAKMQARNCIGETEQGGGCCVLQSHGGGTCTVQYKRDMTIWPKVRKTLVRLMKSNSISP